MKTVHICASREYDVLVERGLIDKAGELIKDIVRPRKALVISGDNTFPIYGERLMRALSDAGIEAMSLVLPHGEQSKSLANYEKILDLLAQNRFSRSDTLVALGGGVTGDLTGFAAATFQRGMGFVQIPTTLLAMVDSSVGGKTAVNLKSGKNQVGSFYQPHLVICDVDTLSTLPEEEFACGCAEVIKYGVLGSREFFDELKAVPIKAQLEHVIATCVEMKRDIVSQDEFDTGPRQLLNLGHSFGHAVEACSDFTVLHGQGVAIGMALITRAAVEKGYCSAETLKELLDILAKYDLPTETGFGLEELYQAALSDKKINSAKISLVVPESIGKCSLVKVPAENIREWLAAAGIK